jgi:archaellum biogenesis ATPase FlaH
MEKTMKEHAKDYMKSGISVIPVGKDKRPLISWKEFQTRRATEEEIDKWWVDYPEAQIGIVTGAISNFTVVDVEFGGDPSFLPQDTLIVKTGGNGWHYYYKYCEGIMNSARIKELVDIRSEGGFVVAPPSSTTKGSYAVIKTNKPLPFPRYLFKDERSEYKPQGARVEATVTDEEYPGYGKGQRNDQMTRYIGTILRRVHPAEWDTVGMSIIEKANEKNDPPLSNYELGQSYKSIRGREILASKSRPTYAKNEAPPLDLPDDGSDEVFHLADVAERQKITIDTIYPLGMPCFDNVLMGGILPGDLILIGGETGNGKTTLMQDFSANLMLNDKPLKVLLFTFEVLPQFVWLKYQEMGITNIHPIYVPLKNTSGSIDWIEKKVAEAKKKYQVDAIAIDHMGFLAPKQNAVNARNVAANYSTFLTQIARELKALAIREEVPVIVPVHVRKTQELSLNDIANSAGLAQEADVVFLIQRERAGKDDSTYYTDDTTITLAKNRRTGQTVKAWFTMLGGRFCFNNERNSAEELVNPTVVKKEEPVPVVAKIAIAETKKEEASVDDLFEALTREAEAEERDKPF